jgi:hypothetical protein
MTMMEIHTGAAQPTYFGQRRRFLSEAHLVRERSILSGHDLKGWRLSHLHSRKSTLRSTNTVCGCEIRAIIDLAPPVHAGGLQQQV